MAATTITCTTYNQPMRLNASGAANKVYGHMETSGRTLSDIVLLCRIPNGATITDWWFRGTSGETASIFKLGITGSGTETTFGTNTLSVAGPVTKQMRVDKPVPFTVSMSDTDAQLGATVYMTISSGTWTTSTSWDFMFEYVRAGLITL